MTRPRTRGRRAAVDRRALAVAVRDVLSLLSERKPVVVAIDDVQWLDASSASALAFALRRLDGVVRLVLARRLEASELEQAVDVERLRIGPLSVGALHRILQDRFGRPFARQTLLRIHEQSGGNPFFALELARVLDEDVDPLEPLPVPATLEELVRTRLDGLPVATRDALAFVAALGTPPESLLERIGAAPGALGPALAAQVVERERGGDPVHAPVALVGALQRSRGAAPGRARTHRRVRRRIRCCAPAISRSRRTSPTQLSPPRWTMRRRSPAVAAPRRARPSWLRRRCG